MSSLEESHQQSDSRDSKLTLQQQNNFHFSDSINVEALSKLSDKLADRYLTIYENQMSHSHSIDNRVVALEENEQKSRLGEIPHQRKYAFRGQLFSLSTAFLGIGVAGLLAFYNKSEVIASLMLSIPVGVVAVNFLGIANKGQSK